MDGNFGIGTISIHALREEGDRPSGQTRPAGLKFLSTPSARRATFYRVPWAVWRDIFLSTPSARRATYPVLVTTQRLTFLSTPSARRATRPFPKVQLIGEISIHALREEGDLDAVTAAQGTAVFLSTPSARRATQISHLPFVQVAISIHALREEGDQDRWLRRSRHRYFYPRPPRGGRRAKHHGSGDPEAFLSTPSARRATGGGRLWLRSPPNFYPRPPRGGRRKRRNARGQADKFLSTPSARRATSVFPYFRTASRYFYPRPPRGGRRPDLCETLLGKLISIHALREEGDQALHTRHPHRCISIHALREEGDAAALPA